MRYEEEPNYAIVHLMKAIAYATEKHFIFKDLKKTILRTLSIIGKDIATNIAIKYFMMTNSGVKDVENEVMDKLSSLPEIDKDTIYFDGLNKIESKIDEILKVYKYSRIVVFIDDLDGCSSEKVLQIFESTKVFLDISGIVFIIGLSRSTLDKLIERQLKNLGLEAFLPQGYIDKIFQVEIYIPRWTSYSIEQLISNHIKNNKLEKFFSLLELDSSSNINEKDKIIDLIKTIVQFNPRQTKRIINNFVLSKAANNDTEADVYLLQAVLFRKWHEFYESLDSNFDFRRSFLKLLNEDTSQTNQSLLELKQNDISDDDLAIKSILAIKNEIWKFFDNSKYNYKEIFITKLWPKWEIYQSAVKLGIEAKEDVFNNEAFMLLRNGKIDEFNRKRKQEFTILNLKEANFEGSNLNGANLNGANLKDANLPRIDLEKTNLYGANLLGANLQNSNLCQVSLERTNLERSNLERASLIKANLIEANLLHANLVGANLVGANLEGANLEDSNLFDTNLTDVNLKDAYLFNTNLERANLISTNMNNANLTRARLEYALLVKTNLQFAKFLGAILTHSIIINPINYDELLINSRTDFIDSLTNNDDFTSFIKKYNSSFPLWSDEDGIYHRLKERGIPSKNIEDFFYK